MEKSTKKILGWSAGLLVAYILYYKFKGLSGKKIVPVIDNTQDTFITQGMNFKSMADTIFDSMDGYGTDIQPIIDQFAMLKSNADLDALYNAYGTRTISSGRGNIFSSNYTGDLYGALKDELSTSQLSSINQILTQKGIKNIV